MKKITQFILIISVLAALIACKKLPVYESEYAEKPDDIIQSDKELPYSHYDPDSKIRYDVFHNDSMLFLYFDVSDQSSIFKIFAHGLEVYIDKEGKRKKTQGFIYPIQGAVQQRSVMPPQGTVHMQNQKYNYPITQVSPISGNRPMNNNSPNQRNMNQTQEPIRIWFKIKPVGGN
jgi:hypothetical protein